MQAIWPGRLVARVGSGRPEINHTVIEATYSLKGRMTGQVYAGVAIFCWACFNIAPSALSFCNALIPSESFALYTLPANMSRKPALYFLDFM